MVSGPAPAGRPGMTTLVTGEFLPSLTPDPALPDEPSVRVSIEGLIPSESKPVIRSPGAPNVGMIASKVLRRRCSWCHRAKTKKGGSIGQSLGTAVL